MNMDIENIIYQETLSLEKMLCILYHKFGGKRITIQTGGIINEIFLRNKLLDYLDIVIAPVLVGEKDASLFVDGKSFTNRDDLNNLGILKLEQCEALEDSFVRLRYKVVD